MRFTTAPVCMSSFQMSETPSLSAANSTLRPSGRMHGACSSSSMIRTFFLTEPSRTETRKKLRRLPVRAKKPT